VTDDLTDKAREVVLAALEHEDVDVRLKAASLVLARPAPKDAADRKPESAVIQVTIDAETLEEAEAESIAGVVRTKSGVADAFADED
jgi:hypothetical protein